MSPLLVSTRSKKYLTEALVICTCIDPKKPYQYTAKRWHRDNHFEKNLFENHKNIHRLTPWQLHRMDTMAQTFSYTVKF